MTLEFNYSFGYRPSNRSVAFYNDSTVTFAAGKLCVLFALDTGVQTYFEFTERNEVTAIVRCDVLLAAAIKGRRPSVCLFNTSSEHKKFYLAPDSMQSPEFTCLSVSVNLKFIAAQGSSPDWLLVIWFFQTREVAIILNPVVLPDASVFDISFHAGGRDELVVVGTNVFKLYEYQDEPEEGKSLFEEIVFEKFEKSEAYHTIAWPEKEVLVVGSSKGKMLFFRGIEMVLEIILEDDLKQIGTRLQIECFEMDENDKAVTSIVVEPQQLVCAFAGLVVMIYEGKEISDYTLTKLIYLPADRQIHSFPGEMKEGPDRLLSLIVSFSGKDLVATTEGGQMLRCCNFAEGSERQYFTTLLPRSYNNPIIDLDVAKSRPLIASCSQYSLLLWNYSDKSLELRKLFKDKINSVALHPTGLFVALGFHHFCRVFSISYHDLRERKQLSCRNCSSVGFSIGGHLLAVVSKSLIEIYSFITFDSLHKLEGHAGFVTSFDWIENDTKLISCDSRGVICEWDLVSSKKLWKYTAVLSYLSVSANRQVGRSIVASSDQSVRCFENSLLRWTLKCKKELTCVIYCSNGEGFYVGTSDGCIEFYRHPKSDENITVYAHSGRVSGLKNVFKSDFLISSGSDGCVFMWKTSKAVSNIFEGIYSKLRLVDKSDLVSQKETLKQLRSSLQYIDISSAWEFELNRKKHEELLRKMSLNHTRCVEELDEKILCVKEEMQNILFDFDCNKDKTELDRRIRQEVIDAASKLNEVYKKSNSYAQETNNIVLNYENMMDELTANHAIYSCNKSKEIEKIKEEIKTVEAKLLLEKENAEQAHSLSEEYKKKAEMEVADDTVTFTPSQKALLEEEKSKSIQLKSEIEKVKQLTDLIIEDRENKKNNFAQLDYDIKDKINAITILENEFKKLETVMASKEKNCQKQETKFCEMRKVVGSSEKYHSVSRTSIDELVGQIAVKEKEIQARSESVKQFSSCIPQLKDEIRIAEDVYSTVVDKSRGSLERYQRTEKMLRDTQETIKKYTNMLHQCLKKDCDPVKLKDDILLLLNENKVGLEDEIVDTQLLDEYEFQIDKLKNTYDLIKGEPAKSVRDKSMAEFRLSQENSKILRDVHDIQKEIEKSRLVINEMETALGLQAALVKSTKHADELRNKIEFVIEAKKRNRRERKKQMAQLDLFIEEQQKEIERFQTILAGKNKRVTSEKS